MKLGKDAMWRQMDMPLDDALDYLQSQLTIALSTEDIVEGVKAFFEKREPEWTGPMSVSLVGAALPDLRPHPGRRAGRRGARAAGGRAARRRAAADRHARASRARPASTTTCATRAAACSRPAARWTTRSRGGNFPLLLAGDCSIA